jgi:hypothetical protein
MPDDDPTTTNHAYDNTSLDSLQFLAAVMHAPEVDLQHRIAAAEALLPFIQAKPAPTVRPWYVNGVPGNEDVTIKIVVPSLINPSPIQTN